VLDRLRVSAAWALAAVAEATEDAPPKWGWLGRKTGDGTGAGRPQWAARRGGGGGAPARLPGRRDVH